MPYVSPLIKNIFRSLENVNLNTLNGYEKDDVKITFNDFYK